MKNPFRKDTELYRIFERILRDVAEAEARHGKDCECEQCLFPKTAAKDFLRKTGKKLLEW